MWGEGVYASAIAKGMLSGYPSCRVYRLMHTMLKSLSMAARALQGSKVDAECICMPDCAAWLFTSGMRVHEMSLCEKVKISSSFKLAQLHSHSPCIP